MDHFVTIQRQKEKHENHFYIVNRHPIFKRAKQNVNAHDCVLISFNICFTDVWVWGAEVRKVGELKADRSMQDEKEFCSDVTAVTALPLTHFQTAVSAAQKASQDTCFTQLRELGCAFPYEKVAQHDTNY